MLFVLFEFDLKIFKGAILANRSHVMRFRPEGRQRITYLVGGSFYPNTSIFTVTEASSEYLIVTWL